MSASPHSCLQLGPAIRAYLLLTATAMCWAGNAIFGRLSVAEVSPMGIVLFRCLFVVLLIVLFARVHLKRDWPILKSRGSWIFGAAIFGFTFFNSLFYIAGSHTTAVNLGILQGAIPGIVMIAALLLYGTPVAGWQYIGVLITMIGVIIVATAGDLNRLLLLTLNPGDLASLLVVCSTLDTLLHYEIVLMHLH